MFEDLIEALFNVDVDVRPSVKPEVNSLTFDFITLVRTSYINNKIFNDSVS